jgi:hypothetical protein
VRGDEAIEHLIDIVGRIIQDFLHGGVAPT